MNNTQPNSEQLVRCNFLLDLAPDEFEAATSIYWKSSRHKNGPHTARPTGARPTTSRFVFAKDGKNGEMPTYRMPAVVPVPDTGVPRGKNLPGLRGLRDLADLRPAEVRN